MLSIGKMISHPELPVSDSKANQMLFHNGPIGEIYADSDMPEDEQRIFRYCLEWSDECQGSVPPIGFVADELELPLIRTGLCMLYHADFLKSYARRVGAVTRPCPLTSSEAISKN